YSKLNISKVVQLFNQEVEVLSDVSIIEGAGPIQGVIVPGNGKVRAIATAVQNDGFDVRPIVSPTVPKGTERIRICLHEFNTEEEVIGLVTSLKKARANVN
ncbi:MAG: pyridoxal phosphate-dependent aminotransferase family protein, partial [Flavobacteriales bacterium]|nr:pyridoxal phosphate-dependent aminotransferase family protein [Flavobacteriales bacterium]